MEATGVLGDGYARDGVRTNRSGGVGSGLGGRRPCISMPGLLSDFCLATAQHGFRYLALPQRATLERFCWGGVLVAAVAFAVWLVRDAWLSYLETPVVVVVETSQYAIWNMDFPAVTISSLNKVELSVARRLVDSWRLPGNTTRAELLEDLKLVPDLSSPPGPSSVRHTALARLQQALDLNNVSVSDIVTLVSPRCADLLASCRFKGRMHPCGELFVPVPCAEGVCCAFNYFGAKGGVRGAEHPAASSARPITHPAAPRSPPRTHPRRPGKVHGTDENSRMWWKWLEGGDWHEPWQQRSEEGENEAPARTSACGAIMGLTVLLRVRRREYHSTVLASYGFKVQVHEPRDFPSATAATWLLSPARLLQVSLAPRAVEATARALAAPPARRRCLARGERPLDALRHYSFNNCAAQCQRDLTLAHCGCVPVHYPRQGNESVCNLTDVPCLSRHRGEIEALSPAGGTGGWGFEEHSLADSELPCGCLPECDQQFYETDLSEGVLSRQFKSTDVEFFSEVGDEEDFSLLSVYFVDLVGTKYRRDIYYTWRQLLASVGGLLGLVMGISFVSGFEIVYFFSLRPACHALRRRRHRPRLYDSSPPPLAAPALPATRRLFPDLRLRPWPLAKKGSRTSIQVAPAPAPINPPRRIYGGRPWPP